ASPVAAEIRILMASCSSWEGTAAELLSALDRQAAEKTKKLKAWPTTPRALASALRRLAPNLRAAGIDVEMARGRPDRRRMISLRAEEGNDRPHRPQGPQAHGSADLGADQARTQTMRADDLRPPDRPHAALRNGSGKDDADANLRTSEESEEGWL